MAVYTVAQVKINDGERYEKYRERFGAVLQQYDGRLVAADDNPVVQEGQWSYEKIVILEFADLDAFNAFADSESYREIAAHRPAGADSLKIGRAHVCTPVTNAHLVCRLLLENKNTTVPDSSYTLTPT